MSEERYPNKAGILPLMSEVNAWRTRLAKNELKLPSEEYKSIGVWLDNMLKHIAELKLDQDEMAEVLAEDSGSEGISPETAVGLVAMLTTLVEHAGGLENLPPEVKLQVAETLGVIKDLQGEVEPSS